MYALVLPNNNSKNHKSLHPCLEPYHFCVCVIDMNLNKYGTHKTFAFLYVMHFRQSVAFRRNSCKRAKDAFVWEYPTFINFFNFM